jgi:5-methyltetrahydrofolate--homocysteine methyltransferase
MPIPAPPFWGWRLLGGSAATRLRRGATADATRAPIALEDVFQHLDLKTLFRLHWGGKSREGAEWEQIVQSEYVPTLERFKRDARDRGFLEPSAIYGYFPAQSLGNEVLVYDPGDAEGMARLRAGAGPEGARLLERFSFPRQPAWDRLCLSDYFAEVGSGRVDVLPLQIVTVGHKADELSDELNKRGDYTEGYYLHGFATQCAEAMAEYVHDLVRRELGIASSQGRRYSWGYPACPDLEEHAKLFRLLPGEQIGVTLTEGFQLAPEQSTAAMVVHHPEAKYYSTLAPVATGSATGE